MATLDVLDAVRDVADTVVGINSAYRLHPEKPPTDMQLPAAIVSLDRDREALIELSGYELWQWPVRLDLIVSRAGNLPNEQAVIIPLVEAFIAALRGALNLGGDGALHDAVSWQLATIPAYDETYTGAIVRLTVQNQYEFASSYAP